MDAWSLGFTFTGTVFTPTNVDQVIMHYSWLVATIGARPQWEIETNIACDPGENLWFTVKGGTCNYMATGWLLKIP